MPRLAATLASLRSRVATARWRAAVPYAVLALVSSGLLAIYVAAMLHQTGGRLGAPIDDVYIHYNYARHMAAGHWFEYNPGDGVSTGATSLLWTPIVALGYRLGFHGASIILWTLGLNTVFLFCYGVLLYRLSLLYFDSRVLATLLATTILMEGRVLWGFFAGMEIGLYHVLLLGALYGFVSYQRDGRRWQWLSWLGALCLLVLVRPEGSFLAGFALCIYAGWRLAQQWQRGRPLAVRRLLWRREWLWASLPIGLVLLQWLLFYLTTGQVTQNGMRTKSHLYAPDHTIWGVLVPSFQFYRDMVFRHFPWLFDKSLRHLMALVLFGSFLGWSAHEVRRRQPGMFCVMALWFFGGLAVQSVVLNAAYHHGRYQMNYTFIFWFVFIAGVHWLITRLTGSVARARWFTGAVIGFCGLMMANTVVVMSDIFGKDCRAIDRQHVAMAALVKEHVPAGASVGINDAGAIAYFGERYVYDVYGLTTNVSALRKWDGQACIFEQIMRLEPDAPPRRPDYFAIYPDWYPVIVKAGFLREIDRVHIPSPNICGGDTKVLYAMDWTALGDRHDPTDLRRRTAPGALRIVDRLNVADRIAEDGHGYRHWRHGRPSAWGSDVLRYQPYGRGQDQAAIIDGGREVDDQEELRVRGVDPSRPLLVVRRTEGVADACAVAVDGHGVGRWDKTTGSSKLFRDDAFEIPASALTSAELTLHFEVETPDRRSDDEDDEPDEPAAAPAGAASAAARDAAGRSRGRAKAERDRKRPARPRYRAYYYWFAQR